MDIVLGVSMAPATIRMVLVEGENADGVTVDEDYFDVGDANDPRTLSAPDQVIAAIFGTREGASQGGHQLTSAGVTWTDPRDAAALATALAARKIENVMLVSAFLAAAALAQTVGNAIGYEYTAMLFVEPDTATLAVIDSADGSITDVPPSTEWRQPSARPGRDDCRTRRAGKLRGGFVHRRLRHGYRADQAGPGGGVIPSGQRP